MNLAAETLSSELFMKVDLTVCVKVSMCIHQHASSSVCSVSCVYLNLSEESQSFLRCIQRHGVSVLCYFFLSEIPLPDINANHAQPCLFASGSSDTARG